MPFNWKDFLELAVYLQEQIQANPDLPQEAAFRCAIGRTYYAAYGHARKYAKDWLGFRGTPRPEEKSQEHGRLQHLLKSKKRHDIAERLETLRIWRNLCGYDEDLSEIQIPLDLALALKDADYVIKNLAPPSN